MRMILLLALAASLSACVVPATNPPANSTSPATTPDITASIDRAEAAYLRAKPFAEMLIPALSPSRAGAVRLAMVTIEHAFVTARLATSVAARLAALKSAETAMAQLDGAPG